MGCRGQVRIKDSYGNNVFLYTHYGAYRLKEDVARSMEHRDTSRFKEKCRTYDSEYFARVIFDRMKEDDTKGVLSYGIGTTEHGDIEQLITIDCEKKTITWWKDYDWETYKPVEKSCSFEEFIELTRIEKKGEEE
jgi:hypothetical protein